MENDSESFIAQYLSYIGETEAPIFYHRWCCLSMIGAFLGRQYKFEFGSFNIYPNQYIMLIGDPGARKSTAIKLAKQILVSARYGSFSANRSSKEKFLEDLALGALTTEDGDNFLDANLWGEGSGDSECSQMFIACDEFNNFIGNGNIEFISLLGELWDYEGSYPVRTKTSKSFSINNPTINILGGNTHVNFAKAFPSDILGQGFFSRLILVHAEPTGIKITFPKKPSDSSTLHMTSLMQRMRVSSVGKASLHGFTELLLDKIYKTYKGLEDIRFEHYANRRFTHLIKLCLIISANRFDKKITESDVIYANTILTHTEQLMPKALGEFGKSKNSDTVHKVMQILYNSNKPLGITELWEQLNTDIEKIADLGEIIRNLVAAKKLISIKEGLLPCRRVIEEVTNDILDYGMLTREEREMNK